MSQMSQAFPGTIDSKLIPFQSIANQNWPIVAPQVPNIAASAHDLSEDENGSGVDGHVVPKSRGTCSQ